MPDTPLRPHILAAFLPWGGFAGAGRPARRKGRQERREIGMKRDLFFHPGLKTKAFPVFNAGRLLNRF
jgi:hypothetical protein